MVDFPKELDNFMRLSPAKDTVNPEELFFDKIQALGIRELMNLDLGQNLEMAKDRFGITTILPNQL